MIEKSKNNYYPKLSQKLSDKTTSHKSHWSILKTFINDKKIPCIPPVCHDNKFVTDFREKAELSRICFAEQCSLSTKNSELPNNSSFLTEKRLSNVLISNDTMMKILNNLNSINFHDHDMKMLKLWDPSLCKPLSIIFKLNMISYGMEKASVVLMHLKNDKLCTKNYHPVSLLLTCSKLFDRLIQQILQFFKWK